MKGGDAFKLLSDLFIVISGLTIIPIVFVVVEIIIIYIWKVSEILAYELQDLCTLLR